jgi:dihydrofolate synthase / folylpolyglutamate synthase
MMDYQQTLDYLFSQLPMFHRIGPAAYKADLNNTIALGNRLQHPHRRFPSVHIAGTNGKGSVAHMLASIFQEAGYRTGLCTSPHLKDFRERFKINGQLMPETYVTDFVNRHRDYFNELKPSFFEMTIGLCFQYFADEKVDIAIVETGLGGRLDSTNIITPEISVITNIGFDHTSLLGNTIEAIAGEKAGIIKPGIPVVVGRSRPEAAKVFVEKARKESSAITFADDAYRVVSSSVISSGNVPLLQVVLSKSGGGEFILESSLTGTYQLENICTVVAAIEQINRTGRFYLSEGAISAGIRNVVENTGILGRWQVLSNEPLVICDTGHNMDGITTVLENIARTPHQKLHFVIGMVNDKDVNGILSLLPVENTTYYFCRPDVPRGLDSALLKDLAGAKGLQGDYYSSVQSALEAARGLAEAGDLVFVGGSTFVVAEVV